MNASISNPNAGILLSWHQKALGDALSSGIELSLAPLTLPDAPPGCLVTRKPQFLKPWESVGAPLKSPWHPLTWPGSFPNYLALSWPFLSSPLKTAWLTNVMPDFSSALAPFCLSSPIPGAAFTCPFSPSIKLPSCHRVCYLLFMSLILSSFRLCLLSRPTPHTLPLSFITVAVFHFRFPPLPPTFSLSSLISVILIITAFASPSSVSCLLVVSYSFSCLALTWHLAVCSSRFSSWRVVLLVCLSGWYCSLLFGWSCVLCYSLWTRCKFYQEIFILSLYNYSTYYNFYFLYPESFY